LGTLFDLNLTGLQKYIYKWVLAVTWVTTKMLQVTCNGLVSYPGGVENTPTSKRSNQSEAPAFQETMASQF